MRTRSDFTLRLFMKKIVEYGISDHVRNLVEDVLRHMGGRSPYRGGKTLTDLLRAAIAAARAENDHDTAERLEDALSYAMNVMLAPDMEVKYGILGGARDRQTNLLGTMVSQAAVLMAAEARTFLQDNPEASIDDLLRYLDSMQDLVVRQMPDTTGGFEIRRGIRENLTWVTEVLRDRMLFSGSRSGPGDAPLAGTSTEDLANAVLLRERRRSLDALEVVVLNRHSSERDLQAALERNLWIFGGTHLSAALGPRRLVRGIELDLTLLRPDGTVHVVELKRACVPLLTHHRKRHVPTNEVHRAVAQAMNYLVLLDEDRPRLAELGIDVRRASATVIIGHPGFEEETSEAEIAAALRVYNSYLSRVEVVTYKQVIDRAAYSLELAAP